MQTSPSLRLPPQIDLPRPAKETLPTMYDLPSEDPEEPGLPDEFHLHQPQLLRETFAPRNYPPDQVFVAADMNLYYDVHHLLYHKRPDWFAVVGVSRFYQKRDLRLSYVIWQEEVSPFIVVELLSPGTEKEDLGRAQPREAEQPPGKWEVYERYLKVPYYVVYSRYTRELQVFTLDGLRYRQLALVENRLWLAEIELGLGMWEGAYQGIKETWLRWYDKERQWIPTPAERAEREYKRAEGEYKRAEQERERAEREYKRAEQERKRTEQEQKRAKQERERAEQAEQRAAQLEARLRALGVELPKN